MTDKVTLTNLANLQNETTAVNAINANSAAITTAMDNTLSRDGTSPNTMGANFDMNSHHILNLPQPATATEPLRLQDLSTFTGGGTVTNIPVGGTNGQLLAKNSSTDYDVHWIDESGDLTAGTNIALTGTTPTTISTIANPNFATSVTTPLVNKVAITAPATTATLTIANNKTLTANNSLTLAGTDATTLTFQGTDTYVGRATTDTLTNKTFDTAGAGNSLKINGQAITSVTGASAQVATVGALTNGAVPRWSSSVLTNGAITDDGTNIVVPGNAQIPTISGGSATNSTLVIKATTNASPSGDVTTLQGSTINISNKAGLGTLVNIGASGTSGVTGVTLAGTTSGITTIVPAGTASGTLTLPAATDTLIGKATTDTLTNKTFDTAGTGNVFKVNGTTVTTASNVLDTISSTQGTILYRNASNWVALAPGTSGQFLQTTGAASNPIWQTGSGATTSGNRTLIATLTANNSGAILSDTTSLTATYNKYVLVVESLLPATNAVTIFLQVHSAGSFPATSYEASATLLQSGTATATITPTTNISLTNTNLSNAGQGVSGEIYVENPSNTTTNKNWWGNMTYSQSANGSGHSLFFGRWTGGNTAIDGFQITTTSGNLVSGTVKIYGIVN